MPVYLMISEEAGRDAPSWTRHQNSYPAGHIQCHNFSCKTHPGKQCMIRDIRKDMSAGHTGRAGRLGVDGL